MAYRNGQVIVLQGSAPQEETGAHTTSDLLVMLALDDSDEIVGEAILEVVNSYGERLPTNTERRLLQTLGITSYERMTREVDAVSISLMPAYNEIQFSPYRRHPPGGWVGNVEDPHFSCPPEAVPTLGRLLKKALATARELPPGK
jgi:hypothetical protein